MVKMVKMMKKTLMTLMDEEVLQTGVEWR